MAYAQQEAGSREPSKTTTELRAMRGHYHRQDRLAMAPVSASRVCIFTQSGDAGQDLIAGSATCAHRMSKKGDEE